jgi:FkbM family methyltransferase
MKNLFNSLFKKPVTNTDQKISYAQSGEDLIIDFIFKYVLGKPQFTFMDIGAHHATYLSNTALFYSNGMKGISIEPDPILFNELKKVRVNEVCLNVGIGYDLDEDKTASLEFFIMSSRTLNTFSKEEAERLHKTSDYKIVDRINVPVIHIHKLFKEHFVPDFISIDVEGIDFEILKSINLEKYRPIVFCIETAEYSPIPPGKKVYDCIEYLTERGYMLYADTFNNSIMIDKSILYKKQAQ